MEEFNIYDMRGYLDSRFQAYYKAKSGFGTIVNSAKRQIRKEKQDLTRKQIRTNVLLDRRNINATTEATTPRTNKRRSNNSGKVDRMAQLKRWRAEKENRLKDEKAKKKPVFKIGGPANVGFPGINANIPGKLTNAAGQSSTLSTGRNLKKSFAPKDHKFAAPKNLKSMTVASQQKPKVLSGPKANVLKNQCVRVTRSQKPVASPPLPLPLRKKRNEMPVVNKNSVPKSAPGKREKDKFALTTQEKTGTMRNSKGRWVRQNAHSVQTENVLPCNGNTEPVPAFATPKRQSQGKSVRKSTAMQDQFHVNELNGSDEKLKVSRSASSTEYSISNSSECSVTLRDHNALGSDVETAKTPESNQRVSVYVSPFVTTSRGKGSVKKENLERSVRGLPSFTKHTTPDKEINSAVQATGAAYFHTVLTNEIARLLATCDTWNQYKLSARVPEDARDMIDVAVGQANLLVNKKFQQFRGLIISCENGGGEQPVTCEDLHGFWDMVYMQVENLNVRFNRLTEMRNNNWEEIQAEVQPKVLRKRVPAKKTKTAPSSNLRAAMHAARMKSQQSKAETAEASKESVFNGGFFVVRSPQKKTPTRTPNKTPTNKRRSLLATVLSTETSKQQSSRVSSPGVTMMKASQTAKFVENIAAESVKDFALPTPGRSILKSTQYRKSYWNTSKAVLFQDESNDGDAAEHREQNKSTSNFIVEDTTENTPNRKSRRSSVRK